MLASKKKFKKAKKAFKRQVKKWGFDILDIEVDNNDIEIECWSEAFNADFIISGYFNRRARLDYFEFVDYGDLRRSMSDDTHVDIQVKNPKKFMRNFFDVYSDARFLGSTGSFESFVNTLDAIPGVARRREPWSTYASFNSINLGDGGFYAYV